MLTPFSSTSLLRHIAFNGKLVAIHGYADCGRIVGHGRLPTRLAARCTSRRGANILRIRRQNLAIARSAASHLILALCLLCSAAAFAQKPAGAGINNSSLPDSPEPKKDSNPALQTTTRFVGYMTN